MFPVHILCLAWCTGFMASIRSILIGLTINIDTKQFFLILGLSVKLDLIGFENSSENAETKIP
jgi:hypothetical protein